MTLISSRVSREAGSPQTSILRASCSSPCCRYVDKELIYKIYRREKMYEHNRSPSLPQPSEMICMRMTFSQAMWTCQEWNHQNCESAKWLKTLRLAIPSTSLHFSPVYNQRQALPADAPIRHWRSSFNELIVVFFFNLYICTSLCLQNQQQKSLDTLNSNCLTATL